jgi:hypothetical protein
MLIILAHTFSIGMRSIVCHARIRCLQIEFRYVQCYVFSNDIYKDRSENNQRLGAQNKIKRRYDDSIIGMESARALYS